jgi:hypothetical protein
VAIFNHCLLFSLDTPKKLSDFYQHAINVLFSVVIATTFPLTTEAFIQLTKLANFDNLETALTLVFVYFFIITSWVGYFKSITNKPHTETKLGTARFGVDIFLVYLFYYLLTLVPDNVRHDEIFMGVLPIIFGTFLLWDTLKYLEYRREQEEARERIYRLVITLMAFAAFLFLLVLYRYLTATFTLKINEDVISWNLLFITLSFIIVALYRWRKWESPRKGKRHLTP